MGRTISGYEKRKTSDSMDFKKNKKSINKRKNKNISKWGKVSNESSELQVDTFLMKAPVTPEETGWE